MLFKETKEKLGLILCHSLYFQLTNQDGNKHKRFFIFFKWNRFYWICRLACLTCVYAFLQKLKRYSDRCFTKDFYKENKFLKPLFVMSMLVALSILYLHFLALWAICVPKLFRKQLASLHHK